MLRKMLAAFLCLTLVLFIPLQCLADMQHTFTTAISDKRISDPATDDFLKVTALHVVTGEKALGLSFAVGNAQATLALRADENGFFVHSNCLSEKVLYFTWDEAFDFLQNTLACDVNFDAFKTQCVNAFSACAKGEQSAQAQGELLAAARALFANDPAMVAWLVNLASRIQLTKGVFTSAAHDTATQKIELLLTAADVSKLCATAFVKAQHAAVVATEHPEMSRSEQAALVSTQAEQLQTALQGMDISLPITLFTADHGRTLVSMALPLSVREMANGTEADEEPITLSTRYNRLTTRDGIEHSGSQVLAQGASQPAVAAFDYLQAKDTSHGTWRMLVQNNELQCVYDAAHANGVTQRSFSVYERANAVSLLPLEKSAQPLMTFFVQSQANQLPLLDEIQAATAETALQYLRRSAEEQAAFKQTMVACLTKAMAGITSQLPISVFNAMVSND
ncbi:MAG: hypothetical protein RR865_03885 [Clostridia bacterium]